MTPLITKDSETAFERARRIMGKGEKEAEVNADHVTTQNKLPVYSTNFPADFDPGPPSPWTDAEFEAFACQEPLPPNQSFQLPAEEPKTEEIFP